MTILKSLTQLFPLAIIMFGVVSYSIMSAAWTGPTDTAPAGNIAAPLNVSNIAQDKNGVLGLNGLSIFGDQVIDSTSPAIKFSDSDGRKMWLHNNSDTMYVLASRDGDGSNWESPYPMQLHVENNSANDYATFSNQVRATEYCNRSGGNCFAPGAVIGVNQQWTNVTGSRNVGTRYRNTTGAPIMVAINPDGQNNLYNLAVSNNGTNWITIVSKDNGDGGSEGATFIVPDNVYYRMTGDATIGSWAELR
jgi:hypothetical protein